MADEDGNGRKPARHDPYGVFGRPARITKIYIQMAIGVTIVGMLALRAAGALDDLGMERLATAPPLVLVSYGLMYAAGVELAYMLFTNGPDEAVDPVILALASATMLVLSDEIFDWRDAIVAPALCLSIAGMFGVRRYLLPGGADDDEALGCEAEDSAGPSAPPAGG